MIVRDELLDRIREVENVFIPMRDGRRLAARLFLPKQHAQAPAILEFIPYRKRDFMRERDEPMHRYFAAHGFGVVRVDVRGSGDSDGVLTDEYSEQELDDGVEVVDWISRQPWCSGAVGMMGISWGGFNSLQVAARRPPALRAVISLCASDDRYSDDAHYMGGCLLNENFQWGSILTAYNAMPPDPLIVGASWKSMWTERLEAAIAFPERWMKHPWRDEFWRQGSVCEDYSAIQCPVYAIGGWADGYSNAVPRLLKGLTVPSKGLIGPWAHAFPHRAIPGPSIGFLQEAIRWWRQWLCDEETGIMDEPQLRVWMQESIEPAPQYLERPGRWVAERSWPSSRLVERSWALNARGLSKQPSAEEALSINSPQITGMVSGEWCGFGADGEMPLDQRPDDGRSLVFDSDPLDEGFEILGAPVLDLKLATDSPVAMIAVRLCEVTPSGASTRVTYGLLNLTHRDSHAEPRPLEPGRRYDVVVALNDIAHSFAPGNRIRVAISTTYWPIAWPSPTPTVLTIFTGSSSLTLPERPTSADDSLLAPFLAPEMAPGSRQKPFRPLPFHRRVERDLVTDELVYTLRSDGGEFGNHARARLDEINLELGYGITKSHRIVTTDPLSAKTTIEQWVELVRDDWKVRIELTTQLGAAEEHFTFDAILRAFEDGESIFERTWDVSIPRRLA